MKIRQVFGVLWLAAAMAACGNDDDFVAPSFIHIDAIKLRPSSDNSLPQDEGFYTHDIVSCYVQAYYPESQRMERIGLFELPFTVPVLYNGDVEYFVISPCIKVSGVFGMQNYYPFYQRDTIRNLSLRSGDTLRLDTLDIFYRMERLGVRLFEPFEPTEASLALDSVTWHRHAPADACTGEGYASVHVPDSVSRVPFYINRDFYVHYTSTTQLYLELDTRSDVPFEIYMESSHTTGGSTDVQRVMVVNPSENWKHIYITLGATWGWFNYNSDFRLSFAALNAEGKEGDVRIDNVRVLTTTAS